MSLLTFKNWWPTRNVKSKEHETSHLLTVDYLTEPFRWSKFHPLPNASACLLWNSWQWVERQSAHSQNHRSAIHLCTWWHTLRICLTSFIGFSNSIQKTLSLEVYPSLVNSPSYNFLDWGLYTEVLKPTRQQSPHIPGCGQHPPFNMVFLCKASDYFSVYSSLPPTWVWPVSDPLPQNLSLSFSEHREETG